MTERLHFHFPKHRGAGIVAREQTAQFIADVLNGEAVGKKFLNDLAVGNEIDERDVFALDEKFEGEADKSRHGRFVAHDLRHVEKGGFEGGSSACDKGCGGLCEQRIGLVFHQCNGFSFDERGIEIVVDGRSTSHNELIFIRKRFGGLNHRRKIVLDFLSAAAGEESDDGRPPPVPSRREGR